MDIGDLKLFGKKANTNYALLTKNEKENNRYKNQFTS